MANRYAESSGKPSCPPKAACEPQDRPSNQIKSNQFLQPTPPPRFSQIAGGVSHQDRL